MPGFGRRAGACSADSATAALEDPDSLRWPVGGEGLADDPVSGHGSPEAAVLAGSTVVAHHEVMIGRDRDLLPVIARSTAPARVDVVLVRIDLAVDDRMAVADGERVPRPGDDPLDESLVGVLLGRFRAGLAGCQANATHPLAAVSSRRRVEDDDVAD